MKCVSEKEKIKGSILLTAEQTKLFLNNFENIVKSLSSYEKINDETQISNEEDKKIDEPKIDSLEVLKIDEIQIDDEKINKKKIL